MLVTAYTKLPSSFTSVQDRYALPFQPDYRIFEYREQDLTYSYTANT